MLLRCLALCALLSGCGSNVNGSAAAGSGGGSAAVAGSSTATGIETTTSGGNTLGQAFTAHFDPVTIQPGAERTQCVIRAVDNSEAVHIGTLHNELSSASHHLIVYRTNDTQEVVKPFDCKPFADLLSPAKGTPLMITQKKDDTLALPKGIAFAFAPKQFVRLEMHYINTTTAPIEASATTTLYAMPENEVTAEADFLFVGDPDIDIPAHGTQTLGPIYLPAPAAVGDAHYFGITGHQHHYGTGVKVWTVSGNGGTTTPVYAPSTWNWSEPPTVYFDPPFQVPPGGGFEFTCTWKNTSDAPVKFGESAEAEMCFFWTYYYPSKGAFVCAHTDQYLNGYNLCCPGNPFCSKLFP